MTSAANVSSYARAIACTNHSLKRLLVKKNLADLLVFCLNVDCEPFLLARNDFCTLPLNVRITTFTNSAVKTNYSRVK